VLPVMSVTEDGIVVPVAPVFAFTGCNVIVTALALIVPLGTFDATTLIDCVIGCPWLGDVVPVRVINTLVALAFATHAAAAMLSTAARINFDLSIVFLSLELLLVRDSAIHIFCGR
jgi:hypothetical protein